MGALDAQSAPGTPPISRRTPILSDFGAQTESKWGPKWSPNPQKINPKIDPKIGSTFYRFWVVLWCQNAANFGAKSNRTGTSTQKGRLLIYPIKTNVFSMFWGIQGSNFEQITIENRSKIEAIIRPSFFEDFLLILGDFWSHFGKQNGSKMPSKKQSKLLGAFERALGRPGAPRGVFS